MKKIFLALPAAILIFIFFGCSDDTTTSTQKNIIVSTNISKKPDTLNISFTIQDTTFSFSQADSILSFSGNPKIIYSVTCTNGFGDFNLYFPGDTNNYHLHFSGYKSDSYPFGYVPWKYDFLLRDFTGSGTIKVVR